MSPWGFPGHPDRERDAHARLTLVHAYEIPAYVYGGVGLAG